MSARITLHCNTVRGHITCAAFLITDGLTLGEARTIGAAHGWRHMGGRDYCPACSGTRSRPRVITAACTPATPSTALAPAELLQNAGEILTALVNRATAGWWAYRPGISSAVGTLGAAHVIGGERGTAHVARTGPAHNPQAAADAAYIAALGPETGRALTAVLHEACESVTEDGGLVENSLTAAAVDLAAAIHHQPAREPR